jgi:hypothetical protein
LFCVVLRMCKEKSIMVHFIITSNDRGFPQGLWYGKCFIQYIGKLPHQVPVEIMK